MRFLRDEVPATLRPTTTAIGTAAETMVLERLFSKDEASAMTGYTVHTGTNDKFSAGWDNIFAAGKGKKGEKKAAEGAKKSEKKAAKAEKADRKVKRGK